MLIAGLTTALAIAAVLIAIGYRLFRSEGSAATRDVTAVLPKGAQLSGADIEAILVRSKFTALNEGREQPTEADVRTVVQDFVPPSYPLEIELQNLAAVQECTSRELLPEGYRTLERDFITRRIRELKTLLEER